ncbi:MAG: dienelactone hydrolase family protein [Verrucomicrobia bacterium]|nr:dienelactone hydrolase family protein [Verrucomicrobiota bacterium]
MRGAFGLARLLLAFVVWLSANPSHSAFAAVDSPEPLPGTQPLLIPGDIASNMVAGVDRFLLRKLDESVEKRAKFWKRDFSSDEAYTKSLETNRARLARILGVRERRIPFDGPEAVAAALGSVGIGAGTDYTVYAVRWPVFGDVHAEGLLLEPKGPAFRMDPALLKRYGLLPPNAPAANVRIPVNIIAIPDADQTPEQIVGLAEGVPPESRFARRLAESGCRVLIPTLISRGMGQRKVEHTDRGSGLSNREFLYRSAFELGRHLIGYEVQKVLAAVDWLDRERSTNAAPIANRQSPTANSKIGVIGWGEGGMIALYAAALDTRIDAACVSGYFENRLNIWQEPIDRNVFGLLEQFGDAELASMIAPGPLIVEASKGPEATLPGKGGGAPARLVTPKLEDVRKEFERAQSLIKSLRPAPQFELVVSGDDGTGPYCTPPTLEKFLKALSPGATLAPGRASPKDGRTNFNAQARLARQMHEIDCHNQWLLTESSYVRAEFMKKLDTGALDKYAKSAEWYRQFFYDEVIGRFDDQPLPPNVRSRKAYDTEKWTGYEVVLDVFPDVIAYGVLLLPKDIKPGERRPVVVCQHGLEGRPQDVITGDHRAYHDFAAKLAERGFITFAPQNLYIFTDRFRTLQRKANPLKKTLFSIITPQHQQIVNWLKTLPYVDEKRIAFYGLSYGGKTAMRVPALITDYCLSICSADFNEWVWKNASTRSPYSYVWTGEYEIFEFDLGSTFNYAEMAALIAPRPFMVERGHFDGVAPDETVGYEFAKVRFLYEAKLGLGDRCELEWFAGPHTINGKGTFDFLHKHLNWPKP